MTGKGDKRVMNACLVEQCGAIEARDNLLTSSLHLSMIRVERSVQNHYLVAYLIVMESCHPMCPQVIQRVLSLQELGIR